MTNVLLKKEYPKEYTTTVSTRVSNALLVGEVIGQVVIGYDRNPNPHSEASPNK
jgi:hypothetical protein